VVLISENGITLSKRGVKTPCFDRENGSVNYLSLCHDQQYFLLVVAIDLCSLTKTAVHRLVNLILLSYIL
jgi:hypothetical protein